VVAVVRDGRLYRYDDPVGQRLLPGDRVVCVAIADVPASGTDRADGS
jgi:hypothetical protein